MEEKGKKRCGAICLRGFVRGIILMGGKNLFFFFFLSHSFLSLSLSPCFYILE